MKKRDKPSQTDIALEIERELQEYAGVLFDLARAPRGVQRRVLDRLKMKKPSVKLLEPFWLSAIESHRKEYGDGGWSDLKVIEHYLVYVPGARYGREEGQPFRPNAARTVIPSCEFNLTRCADGLEALRAWMYEWNEEREEFSKEPRHDWSSHSSDGFSYGAQVMREHQIPVVKPTKHQTLCEALERATRPITFDEAIKRQDRRDGVRRTRV